MMKGRRTTDLTRVLAIGIMLAVAGCNSDGLFGANQGRVRVVLSGDNGTAFSSAYAANDEATPDDGDRKGGDRDDDSRPSWWFVSANVTLSSVLVRTLDGVLVPVDIELPVTVDVVKMEGGKQIQLPDGLLPADTYDQVVVVMTAVQGITHNGTRITVEPPGGGWTAVIPICPLEVAEGETETVGLKLLVRNSFLRTDNHWTFQPRFRSQTQCIVDDDDEG